MKAKTRAKAAPSSPRKTFAPCGKTIAKPAMTMPMPTYIGLRTKRYGPLMTSCRGGSHGAGGAAARQANCQTHGSPTTARRATAIQPSGRGSAKTFGPASQRGSHHSHKRMKSGATTSVRRRAKSLRTIHIKLRHMSTVAETPIAHTEPTNAKILAISEDQIQGFVRDPFGEIAAKSGLDVETVMERIRAMLRAGTIRRVRQTLMATNLAEGALVAWQYPPDKLETAFDYMFQKDPFSGHVVTRSTDAATPGSNYRLWTTVKVPQGYSVEKHCAGLARLTGAEDFRGMPANGT